MIADLGEIPDEGRMRIDRWLWFARFFKSRNNASRLCNARKVRVDGRPVIKASHNIKVGDILTFPQGRQVRTVAITSLGTRRGPASEAQTLYSDLVPSLPSSPSARDWSPSEAPPGQRNQGSGRPTKSDRRAIDRLRGDG